MLDKKALKAADDYVAEAGRDNWSIRRIIEIYLENANKHTLPDTHICDLMRAMDGTCFRCGDKRTQT